MSAAQGDRLLLESALRNLIDNAIKYSPPETEIAPSLAARTESAVIAVRDAGGLGGRSQPELPAPLSAAPVVDDVVGLGLA